jgi:cytochrome c553
VSASRTFLDRLKQLLTAALVLVPLAAAGALIYAWTGLYDIGAAAGHWAITRWLLEFGMRNSIETHAMNLQAPFLDDNALFYRGLGHYVGGCAPCHGGPGQARNLVVREMLPAPPALAEAVRDWEPEELFWIVKNGIKYAGMPAWPTQERDDEVWAVTAFLMRMPDLDPLVYRRLALDTAAVGDATAEAAVRPMSSFGPVSEQLVNCARCHGREGGGGGAGAFPRLAGQKVEYLYKALQGYAAGTRPSGIMQPIAAELDDQEMRALASRYAAADAPWMTPTEDPQAQQRGAELFRQGLPSQGLPPCETCHGAEGRGIDKHPAYPALAGQFASYLEAQLALWRDEGAAMAPYAQIMRSIGHRLEPDQAQDVAAYLSSLPPRKAIKVSGGGSVVRPDAVDSP